MNTSKYIDTKNCAKCAQCCTSFQIGYSKKSSPDALSEVERFKLLDTNLVEVTEDKNGYWIEFKIPCKHLKTNNKGYYCKIYNSKRPLICEKYPGKNSIGCPHKKIIKKR